MATFIITYDLRKVRDYSSLYNAIKSYGTWARITESSWAIVTNQTAVQVRDFLLKSMDGVNIWQAEALRERPE